MTMTNLTSDPANSKHRYVSLLLCQQHHIDHSQLLRKVLERQAIDRIDSRIAAARSDKVDPNLQGAERAGAVGNVKLGAKEKRRRLSDLVTDFPLPEDLPQQERDMLVLSLRQFLYKWILPFQTSGTRPTAEQLPDIAELLVRV